MAPVRAEAEAFPRASSKAALAWPNAGELPVSMAKAYNVTLWIRRRLTSMHDEEIDRQYGKGAKPTRQTPGC